MRIEIVVAAGLAVVSGAGVGSRTAPAAPPVEGAAAPVAPARFEDPCLGGERAGCPRALDHFTSALAAARAGTATRPLRISYYGDSLVAGDSITHALRKKLGALAGDGGPGFIYAAPPHPYCQHRAATRFSTGEWHIHGIAGPVPPDHLLGLGGSAETDGGGAVRITASSPVAFADVHYLGQPAGGSFSVLADGKPLTEVATLRPRKQSDFARIPLPAGTKRVELRAAGRVRLFGAALEAARGVVVDNLGVVNASVLGASANNQQDHWRGQLARRDADLVILMLGTNEAEWLVPGAPNMADHERRVGVLAASIRAAVPGASCLLISPLDQIDYKAPGLPPRASVPAIVEVQRRVAVAAGCAFWDAYRWMGGAGASRTWHRNGLVVGDFQHPTEAGSLRLADALYAGLVR